MEGQPDVERIIKYHFTSPHIFEEAFEAAGVSELNKGVTGQRHGNKRLALVGDALIRLAILDRWFPSGASTEEGNNLVSDLASNNALKNVVERDDLVRFVVKNPSQKGGPQRATLASTTEAIVGAVWCNGVPACDRYRAPNDNMESNERTPLIAVLRIAPRRQRYQNIVVFRFFAFAFGSTLILVVLFVLRRPRPVVDTQICHSSLGTSKAYAGAKALNNNIDDFCQEVTNNEPVTTIGWTWSKIYYRNTPEEYTMTVAISNRAFSSYENQCIGAMRSIINGCDVPVNGSNPMNWKQGGKRLHGDYTYKIDIFRQNRPWPPPTKPRQACEGWYKIIWQHYDIYGGGWANYDWGAKSLQPAINPCCGLGSLTGWNFEYFDEPDENGYEWHSWFNTAIGTRRRCFDNNRIQCAAGGPCDSYCGGNG
ncbi:hypothetical protein V494_00072 [Pseudogymnoascus sp. VKM F-4513 (FW-928)]|nr:hypothetical protein V490_00517 [Pseudogymnoascus sp. VKM F-3557]KFY47260.1 hypothetical protein V494_00072 [Pseudogymnoascus sp. VKM F-4513 (FW-928)]